jgi:uncharacterized protein with beta-barrel porin domain
MASLVAPLVLAPVAALAQVVLTPTLGYVTLDDGSTGTFLTGIRGDTIVGNIVNPDNGTGGVLYSQSAASWQPFPVATSSGANYPDATSSSPYGPGFGSADGVLIAVGSYKTVATGAYDTGYLYDAAAAPGHALTTLSYPGNATLDTIPHSTFGDQVVGNYDTGLATGNAFIYTISTGSYVTNNDPGSVSTTAYGVWGDKIAGGTTQPSIAFERGYIYDETTGTWTLYNHPGAVFTHFEGISGGGRAGTYNLVADWAGPDGQLHASVLHIAADGSQTWIELSILGAATVSANSIYGNTAIGIYTTSDGAINGYTVAIPGIYNPISNSGPLVTVAANTPALSGGAGDDLLNTGTIRTSGPGSAGLSSDTYGVVTNSGAVSVAGTGSAGVAMNGLDGTLLNSGTISAPAGAYAIRTGATAFGTVIVNTGVIDGQVLVSAGPQVRFENSGWLGNSATGSGTTNLVSGTFVQTAQGTLAPRVSAAGADTLQVLGMALLNGTLAPVAQGAAGGGAPVIGEQFPIVAAQGGIAGSFAALTQPAGLAANSRLDALYGTSTVTLVVTPASYASFAGRNWAAPVAAALDAARPEAGVALSSGQSAVYAPLYEMPASAIIPTLQQIAPVIYSDTLMVNRSTFQMVSGAVESEMDHARGAPGAVGASTAPGPHGTTIWLQGSGQFVGLSDGANGAPGYHGSSGGMVAGIDAAPRLGARLGLAVGFNSQTINTQNDATYSGQAVQVVAYGGAQRGIGFVDAQLGMAYTEGNTSRTISAFGISPRGDVDGLGVGGAVRGGARWDVQSWAIEPSLTLSGLALNQHGVTETAPGQAGLVVNGSSIGSLQTLLGVQVDHRFPLAGAYAVVPSVLAGWAYEMLDTTARTTASFVAAPGTAFTVTNPSIGRDAAVVSVRAVLETGTRLQAYAAYDAAFNGMSSAQTVTGGIRYAW